jgi:D-3-phosphoglycerate dehydrogenase
LRANNEEAAADRRSAVGAVVAIGSIDGAGIDVLTRRGLMVRQVDGARAADLPRLVADADALIVRTAAVGAATIAAARRLKVVARYGVGVDNIDVAALSARGIPLATVGDANAVPVAEHAFALLLAVAKRIPDLDRLLRAGGWSIRNSASTWELSGKTILLVGLGRVGRAMARRCLAFDMRVIAVDPAVSGATMDALGVERRGGLDEALAEADIVSLHLPLSADTRGLFGAGAFARMRQGAVLVNTARGGIVDEAALREALARNHLAAVALDVFAVEPPAPDDPLLADPRLIVAPHHAGLTRECVRRMSLVCAENVLAALDGRPDRRFVVNPEALRGPL